MARRIRTFTIDDDLNDKISREPNASKLVNDLLRRHYNSINNTGAEGIAKKLKELEATKNSVEENIKSMKQQLGSVEEDEAKRKTRLATIFEKLPQEIIDELKNHGPMFNEYSLRSQYDYVYSKKYPNLKWEELKEAYEEFEKNQR